MGKEYCVTGGTGFIAAYLVKALLLDGHVVRATVRDPGTWYPPVLVFMISCGVNSLSIQTYSK